MALGIVNLKHFGPQVFSEASARTESKEQTLELAGTAGRTHRVRVVQRGIHHIDWYAECDGNKSRWGAGKSSQEAIDSMVRNGKSHDWW